jgi:pimeloyl-ACP methyl ester carboxylesterase
MAVREEAIIGKYAYIPFNGTTYRVYYETVGEGIPLVCLHTAGAHGTEYRDLMNDPYVTSRFKVYAFDLPFHGKSVPPEDLEWWKEEYRLTTDFYAGFIVTFIDALEIENPIVLGCSMGGNITLKLAADYADKIGAVIGLEAQAGGYEEKKPGAYLDVLYRPDIHGGEASAELTIDLCAPMIPENRRWELWWFYTQEGAGVYNGDLYFFSHEWDIREKLKTIDTEKCPVYLLTGEYDWSCTPKDTLEAAEHIKGVKVTIMDKIGHFPMAEHWSHFFTYIEPVFEELIEHYEKKKVAETK